MLRPVAGNARRELDAELGFHIEALIQDLVAGGMARDAARVEAERRSARC